ncbi:MAG: hypothetical protein O9318_13195 [Hylemonella sp.]|uniref:hypothetical protein n=1 Tax=Hylemonella sp. TaxID=2066020 RepID=UPI0022C4F221|nr:hypothetical protein [Hylemonella sp.]MCZ8253421.1 hypothetical protein [Hylemonella sp.]
MALDHLVPDHAAPVAHIMDALSTRTLNHFAEEARQNGESLKDAFERYEIDYAWHVLGSDRLREATLACLVSRQPAVTAAQKDSLAGILQAAAAAQASDLLMSFDNDVPEKLADFLSAAWAPRGTH